jgi:hypothetical protein
LSDPSIQPNARNAQMERSLLQRSCAQTRLAAQS